MEIPYLLVRDCLVEARLQIISEPGFTQRNDCQSAAAAETGPAREPISIPPAPARTCRRLNLDTFTILPPAVGAPPSQEYSFMSDL